MDGHLIWHLPGKHQVIESSGTHQGFSLPERGLNGGDPTPKDRADIWGRGEGSDWLGPTTGPHIMALWTGKYARLCNKEVDLSWVK